MIFPFQAKVPSQSDHPGLFTQGFQIGSNKAMSDLSKAVQIDVRCQRHVAAVDLQDFVASANMRNGKNDLTVKTSWPSKGRVYHFRDIGRPNDNDMSARNHAVHQSEELGNHSLLDISQNLRTLRGDAIDFIDKDNTRRVLG